MMIKKLLLIALAGGMGSLARYGLSGLVQNIAGGKFAWGTATVNVLGCFLFGTIWSLTEEKMLISGETRAIILTGFMGAFTTFSTYIFETGELMRDSQWILATTNIFAQIIIGLFCFFIGLSVGRIV
jgi:CrcB protein